MGLCFKASSKATFKFSKYLILVTLRNQRFFKFCWDWNFETNYRVFKKYFI